MTELFSDPTTAEVRSSVTPTPIQTTYPVSLHVEVALRDGAKCRSDAIQKHVEQYLRDNYASLTMDTVLCYFEEYAPVLRNNVQRIHVVEVNGTAQTEYIRLKESNLIIHVYKLYQSDETLGGNEDQNEEGSNLPLASSVALPARSLGQFATFVTDWSS